MVSVVEVKARFQVPVLPRRHVWWICTPGASLAPGSQERTGRTELYLPVLAGMGKKTLTHMSRLPDQKGKEQETEMEGLGG